MELVANLFTLRNLDTNNSLKNKCMKTIEKAANEQAYNFVHNNVEYSHPNFVANEKKQSFEDGVEFAQQFIDIKTENPTLNSNSEISTELIVKDICCNYHIGFYTSTYIFVDKNMKPIESVTHWRPIEIK